MDIGVIDPTGRTEIDMLDKIFRCLGTPNDTIWPGYSELPIVSKVNFKKQPYNNLQRMFPHVTPCSLELMNKLLMYDPKSRLSAAEALKHPYFRV